jgi:hypothetical protein
MSSGCRLVPCLAAVAVLVAGAGAPPAAAAPAAVYRVTDEASFVAALAKAGPGDVVELADGTYPVLTVAGESGVSITGGRGARLDGIVISRSSDVTLRGVTVTPAGDRRANVIVEESSSGVVIEDVLVDGRDELVGAGIVADETVSDLTIRDSELTNCGRGTRCVGANRSHDVVVSGNRFHDCLSCDFIRASGGMTIRGNTFDRAVNGSCEQDGTSCPHNDLVQILGGGPWRIVGNRFGEREGGAASIYVSPGLNDQDNPIHDVDIVSNVFSSTSGRYAIKIKGGAAAGTLIDGVSIVNNTVMSGTLESLALETGWESLGSDERPLVANNIFLTMKSTACGRGIYVANVVKQGNVRCAGLRKANPALNKNGGPTKASRAVVNKADPGYAPKTDFYGRFRNGKPDIGAIEFRGKKKASSA